MNQKGGKNEPQAKERAGVEAEVIRKGAADEGAKPGKTRKTHT